MVQGIHQAGKRVLYYYLYFLYNDEVECEFIMASCHLLVKVSTVSIFAEFLNYTKKVIGLHHLFCFLSPCVSCMWKAAAAYIIGLQIIGEMYWL